MNSPIHINRDICIYGSSPTALTAALAATAEGQTVALVAPGPRIGGMLIEGLGRQDINNNGTKNKLVIGGLAREFYQRVGAHYGEDFTIKFESHVAENIIKNWLIEANIEVFYNNRLAERFDAVRKEGTRIVEIEMENGNRFSAQVFIDGTIEGDLMKWAGVSYTTGREGNATYGETLNGIRATSYQQFAVDVDPYRIPGKPSSGLIATVQDSPFGEPGDGDHSIMGFCFRQCLTNEPDNQIPFTKPDNYDDRNYEIYRRYFAAGGTLFSPRIELPNAKTDQGSWHDLSGNLYGYNYNWPDGSYAEREAIYNYHKDFIQGLYWFLCNDPSVPQNLQREWSQCGLAADEFTDNAGWPRSLYIRTGRRMVSDYVITEADTKGKLSADDAIGVAWWPPDAHHARRIVQNGVVRNEGFFFEKDYVPFPISYRAITPKRAECSNLLVSAALSSSYVGYGSVRLEWTQMVCGQSAGIAAATAIRAQSAVQAIDIAQLQNTLLKAGQILKVPH